MIDLVEKWKEAARCDDLFNHMVPSDVRLLVQEIERLRIPLLMWLETPGNHRDSAWWHKWESALNATLLEGRKR